MKRWVILGLLLLIWTGCALAGGDPMQEEKVRIYTSEESFEDVVENIKLAVIDRGMLVSGTLHISEMLNRTGPDLGFPDVFLKAESVEFCSALISHKMAQVAAQNVVICPFTIAVYVSRAQPKQVFVAYRVPRLAGKADEVTGEILQMLDGIVEDSI
jgi:uncharacterized protein (DUF302 family)